MRARYVVRITPADVGSRVTIRSAIAGDPGGASATDTIGRLVSWTEGVLVVERRDGTRVELREGDLLAARVVPPPPPRRGGR